MITTLRRRAAPAPARVAAETLTVTDPGNEGPGPLRDLVERAASNDTIVIPGGMTVSLQREIVITKNLTITGATISGQDATRIFSIRADQVTLNDLILTDGNALQGDPANPNGGAIHVAADSLLAMHQRDVPEKPGPERWGHLLLGRSRNPAGRPNQ